ncbi:Exportin-7 [Glycine soja]|uniref:Exportin-7 n=1 Tax=Glycine soja TaxID=3848 RepID=A0A0B2Q5N8_GLYSO|nr:Exportin-7 [Glycine soja]
MNVEIESLITSITRSGLKMPKWTCNGRWGGIVTASGYCQFHRYGDVSKQRLDRAILTFLQHLRRCYIGDQAVYSSKQLYTRLSELLGLHDHLLLLNVIVGKMTTNLKYYTKCKEVIDHTLNLFLEMTSGYMSGKLLLKLDTVKHILSNQNKNGNGDNAVLHDGKQHADSIFPMNNILLTAQHPLTDSESVRGNPPGA